MPHIGQMRGQATEACVDFAATQCTSIRNGVTILEALRLVRLDLFTELAPP
jgi:hypothetical protein